MSKKTIFVRDAYDTSQMNSLIFNQEEPVEKIIKTFADSPYCRGIFITDDENNLVGVINRIDLLNWAKYRLGAGLTGGFAFSYREIARYAFSTKAKDIANVYGAEAHVKRGDNVLKALDLMLRSSLIDVPVLDDDGKIIGEIKLSEILKKIIELDRNPP